MANNPAIEGCVIHFNAPFFQNFFKVSIGNGVPDIEKNGVENNVFGKCAPLKLIIGHSILKEINYLSVLQILRQNFKYITIHNKLSRMLKNLLPFSGNSLYFDKKAD